MKRGHNLLSRASHWVGGRVPPAVKQSERGGGRPNDVRREKTQVRHRWCREKGPWVGKNNNPTTRNQRK